MTAQTPGQAAREEFLAMSGDPAKPWAELHDTLRARWERIAQAAIGWQRAEDANPTAEDFDNAAEIMRLRGALAEIERTTEWAIDNDDEMLSLEHVRDLARNGLKCAPADPKPAPELAEPGDVRPRADGQRGLDITCGACGEDYGTNMTSLDEIECVECEARRCPHCKTWFGGQS